MIRSVQSEYQNYNAIGNDGKRFICYKRAIGIAYSTLKAKEVLWRIPVVTRIQLQTYN
jgi:hypothetical protein